MLANLDRKKFLELLNTLGDEDREKVLAAAQDLHAQVPERCRQIEELEGENSRRYLCLDSCTHNLEETAREVSRDWKGEENQKSIPQTPCQSRRPFGLRSGN